MAFCGHIPGCCIGCIGCIGCMGCICGGICGAPGAPTVSPGINLWPALAIAPGAAGAAGMGIPGGIPGDAIIGGRICIAPGAPKRAPYMFCGIGCIIGIIG